MNVYCEQIRKMELAEIFLQSGCRTHNNRSETSDIREEMGTSEIKK